MGTRSTIALEFADGTVEQVYCHWDGYLAHNGQILLKHYSDPFVLRDLIDLGDISSLGKIIGTSHPFSPYVSDNEEFKALPVDTQDRIKAATKKAYDLAQELGCTTFYGRDRGETGVGSKKFIDYEDYVDNHQYEEYDYILRQVDGKATWFVSDHDGAYVELEQAIMDEQDRIAQEETA
jgi:hypothetical protein